jgi:hypothetical protein
MFQIGFVGSLPRTYAVESGVCGTAQWPTPTGSATLSNSTSRMHTVWFAGVLNADGLELDEELGKRLRVD